MQSQDQSIEVEDRPKIPPRRVFVLLLPAFFSLGLVVLILVWQEFNPPEWQRIMENYLSAYSDAPQDVLSAGIIYVARDPFRLVPEMPFQPDSSSVYYQTESLPTSVRPDSMDGLGRRPLPFPIMELYCIDLSGSTAAMPASRYLLARHQDLYNADWIVYIPDQAAAPQVVDAAWNELGCNEE